jgi:hypothetical protein
MTVFARRVSRTLSVALFPVAAVAVFSPAALANPVVNFNVAVSGSPVQNFNGVGAPTANPQLFSHQGSTSDTGWNLSWNFSSDPDAVGGGRLGCVFTFENLLADTANPDQNHLQGDITITLPTNPVGLPATFGGNAAMTFLIRPNAFNNDGVLTTVGNNAMWTYGINGGTAATLFAPGFEMAGSSPQQGDSTLNSNLSLASFPFNQPVNNVSIRLQFDITPGDQVQFTGVFLFVPAPGALGVFALAGLMGGRRRRS